MNKTRLSSKGQIVIPKPVREAHGWQPGSEFIIEDVGDGLLVRPTKPVPAVRLEDVIGCTGYRGPRRSLQDMEAAVAKAVRRNR